MDTMVALRDVSKTFDTREGTVRAVDGVSVDIARGEIFGIMGWSGAGKSTLVRLMNGLESPTSGQVVVDGQALTGVGGREVRRARAGIGFIFQQFNLWNSRTVPGNVAYPLRVAGWDKRRRTERVRELLEFVGLTEQAHQHPDQLSGGQKQRVGIARALATSPALLLADEATSALDPETTKDVLDLLRRVNAELGVTVVLITHEMSVVSYLCDRAAVMEHGKVVELRDVYALFATPSSAVTRRFVGSALHDRPRPDVVLRLRERHPGRLVTVTVHEADGPATPGSGEPQAGGHAPLNQAFRTHGVDGAVVHGGITEVASRPLGSLTFELTGQDDAIDALLADLRTWTQAVEYAADGTPLDDDESTDESTDETPEAER